MTLPAQVASGAAHDALTARFSGNGPAEPLPFPWKRLALGLALAGLFGGATASAVVLNLTDPESGIGRLIQVSGRWFMDAGLLPVTLALAGCLLLVRLALRLAGHGDCPGRKLGRSVLPPCAPAARRVK